MRTTSSLWKAASLYSKPKKRYGKRRGGRAATLKQRANNLRKNMTGAEAKLWSYLECDEGLGFEAQKPFSGYILDFACKAARLGIEVDGSIHDLPKQRKYDAIRTWKLERLHWAVIRFRNEEVEADAWGCYEKIVAECRRRIAI